MYETKEPNQVSLAKPNSRSKRCDVRLAKAGGKLIYAVSHSSPKLKLMAMGVGSKQQGMRNIQKMCIKGSRGK